LLRKEATRILSETSIYAKVELIIKSLWYLDCFSAGDLLLFICLATHLNEQASDNTEVFIGSFRLKAIKENKFFSQ